MGWSLVEAVFGFVGEMWFGIAVEVVALAVYVSLVVFAEYEVCAGVLLDVCVDLP